MMASDEVADRTEREHRPSPIDVHVGSRVRLRRTLLGMSQEKLGEALSLTFQQVQKYEKGTNRIGASRLQQISKTLDVTPGYFFEGAPAFEEEVGQGAGLPAGVSETGSSYVVDFLSTAEGLLLNRAFVRIRNPKLRKRIIDLVSTMADDEGPAVPTGQA